MARDSKEGIRTEGKVAGVKLFTDLFFFLSTWDRQVLAREVGSLQSLGCLEGWDELSNKRRGLEA